MNSIVSQRFIQCHNKLREENVVRSSRQFALSLDYLPQSLSELLKGRRDVTIELLRKAIEVYALNPVYLFTGEGPMFMTEEDNKDLKVLTIVTNGQKDEQILHVPIPAQAGYAAGLHEPSFIENLPTYTLPDYKYQTGTHRSFDVAGDAMEPTLFEGDKVVCSYIDPTLWENAVKDHYVYVVVTRGDVLVKRVTNRLKEEKYLQLISDNEYYRPYTVKLNDIREIWYVRAKISPFLPAPQLIQRHLQREVRELRSTLEGQMELIRKIGDVIDNLPPESP